ncbi:hypothetical protein IEQ34_018365 [Dendrobium chrysotoxum]|uniref:Protein LAZ1 homolog 2 n=1 Tax=Dendrobium chrysotoxum TaxID=161865 RepID=A0AAV7GCS3_DENCH|nr:hypothetical protein IEQ34_018365 [Dendrobium chrysotoxum]
MDILPKFFWEGGFSGVEFNDISNFEGVYRNLHTPAIIIGGIFALIALIISLLLIFEHLRSYSNPDEQKWIIGILFMVPVYASESVFSLWKARFSITCDILRDCYEAFALYAFGSYLVACLGGEERAMELLEKGTSKQQLTEQLLKGDEEKGILHRSSFYDFFFNPTVLGKNLYTIVKFGLVQYMILKTLCSFLALLLELFGVYGDGEFKWYNGYPYIAVVINFSQMWALYCLVQFYNVTYHWLEHIHPLAKFISFKAIVFATWWQGVGIAMICYFGVLPKEEKIQNGIQDFLICIEMAVAAIAHIYVFPAKAYQFMRVSPHGKVTSTQTIAKANLEDHEKKAAIVEQKKACIEAPGTSITKSVQDVVIGGGEHVARDVSLTISQAIMPVEKGVHLIQESFHHLSLGSIKEEGEAKIKVEGHVMKNVKDDDTKLVSSAEIVTENSDG